MATRGRFHPDGEPFSYEPQIKNKPNAQGTLFQVNPSQRTPESRQPKGFSPERRRMVEHLLDARRTGRSQYGGHEHGTGYHIYPDYAETLARGINSVARSTVPLEDMMIPDEDKPSSKTNPYLRVGVRAGRDSDPLGEYRQPGEGYDGRSANISLYSGRGHSDRHDPEDMTLIHEVGHHVDAMRHSGVLPYSSPTEQGHAEGFAEAYAREHARTPGYKQRPSAPTEVKPATAWSSTRFGESHSDSTQFGDAYSSHHAALQPQQFDIVEDIKRDLGPKTFPKGHIRGQKALLDKTGDYSREGLSTNIRVSLPDWAGE